MTIRRECYCIITRFKAKHFYLFFHFCCYICCEDDDDDDDEVAEKKSSSIDAHFKREGDISSEI